MVSLAAMTFSMALLCVVSIIGHSMLAGLRYRMITKFVRLRSCAIYRRISHASEIMNCFGRLPNRERRFNCRRDDNHIHTSTLFAGIAIRFLSMNNVMNTELGNTVYELSVADVQTVATEVVGRELSPHEIAAVAESIGDHIDWSQAIENAIYSRVSQA